jgi:hypothetical protein
MLGIRQLVAKSGLKNTEEWEMLWHGGRNMKMKLTHSVLMTAIIILCLSKALVYFTALSIIHPRNARAVAVLSESDPAFAMQELTTLNWAILEKQTFAAKETTRQQVVCDILLLTLFIIAYRGKTGYLKSENKGGSRFRCRSS